MPSHESFKADDQGDEACGLVSNDIDPDPSLGSDPAFHDLIQDHHQYQDQAQHQAQHQDRDQDQEPTHCQDQIVQDTYPKDHDKDQDKYQDQDQDQGCGELTHSQLERRGEDIGSVPSGLTQLAAVFEASCSHPLNLES